MSKREETRTCKTTTNRARARFESDQSNDKPRLDTVTKSPILAAVKKPNISNDPARSSTLRVTWQGTTFNLRDIFMIGFD